MNSTRIFALPIIAAGIIGGAALGLAGTASAATDTPQHTTVAAPSVKAHPAPDAVPGWRNHHGIYHLQNLQPGYTR
jgi:hypothetical protein